MSTAIEWTKGDDGTPGMTWNPVTGCTKVSQGCKNCYAERLFPRVYGKATIEIVLEFEGEETQLGKRERKFTDVVCHPDRLNKPLHWKKPRRIFVNSMSDLFHEDVPFEFIDQVFAVMALAGQHSFQVLSKRPQIMEAYFSGNPLDRVFALLPEDMGLTWPLPNIWLGVSVEDQATADERIPLLLETPAAVRWISVEPLLGPIDFSQIELPPEYNISISTPGLINCLMTGDDNRYYNQHNVIDWCVVGGESGPKARPMSPCWVRSIRDQCQAAGVPFFFKQWGEWLTISQGAPYDPKRPFRGDHTGTDVYMRIGKKTAGCLLDGCEWDERPT